MILVLDESGAKGYARTKEKYEGEVGVIAGFLYTAPEIQYIENCLSNIVSKFKVESGKKFHIADLEKQQQILLREELFSFMKETRLQWLYQALYSEGFHQSEFADGRGGNKKEKESLHVTLFQSFIIQALGMAHSLGVKNLDLEIKSDRIDKSTLKRFIQTANYISNIFLQRENVYFDYIKSKDSEKYKKEFYGTVIKSESLQKFDEIKINIVCEESPLTVMADVLANSLRHHLDKSQKANPNIFLNNKVAIKDHPIVDLAIAPTDAEHVLPLLDFIYRRMANNIDASSPIDTED
ncbi:hypothetical protein T3H00_04420 [Pseudomonas fluorescens]|uniref:hypothetical protein n=1 Tax=Pseudomonas fluorescens TaxID=294 RepID=UPI002ACAB339|nr:hypothetical protein [Pseudomonas fluorescens]MDZ5431910.1 hypothetical protein [Pseudomonas fluorescens]